MCNNNKKKDHKKKEAALKTSISWVAAKMTNIALQDMYGWQM